MTPPQFKPPTVFTLTDITNELIQKRFMRNMDLISLLEQVFLIPAAVESMRLINSSLQRLTQRSELMSTFV